MCHLRQASDGCTLITVIIQSTHLLLIVNYCLTPKSPIFPSTIQTPTPTPMTMDLKVDLFSPPCLFYSQCLLIERDSSRPHCNQLFKQPCFVLLSSPKLITINKHGEQHNSLGGSQSQASPGERESEFLYSFSLQTCL